MTRSRCPKKQLRQRLFVYNAAYYLQTWVGMMMLKRDPRMLPPESAELTRKWVVNNVWASGTRTVSVQCRSGLTELDQAETVPQET